MTEIRQIKDWQMPSNLSHAYEGLVAAVGTEEFGSSVRNALQELTGGARRLYLFEAKDRDNSSLQYFHCEPGLDQLMPAYLDRYLRLDPLWDAYRAAPVCRDVALLRVRPSDIASSGFRHRFFDNCGIVERVSVIQRGNEEWRVMTVARHESEGLFGDDELRALVGLACLTLPMLPHNRKRAMTTCPLTVEQLEDRFASRFAGLTNRERQVCARAAIGMSVEATALDLRIAKTSVLTYRRRAYNRLSVTSPYELCSLVTH